MKVKDIAWNFGGLGGPVVVAALTIPKLIEMIGLERFGLLSLSWGLIGFAGVFDLGVGRATTQTIAKLRGEKHLEQIPPVITVAAGLSVRAGLGGAILLGLAVLAGAHTHIKFSPELTAEVTIAAYLLALAIPLQSMSAMFRGVNEGFERFREISLIRIGLGIATFLGPFLVALFSTHLALLVLTLLLSRAVAYLLFRKYAKLCLSRELPKDLQTASAQESSVIAKQLLSFGRWFSITGLVGPVLVQSDRYFIGALISATATATYIIPFEVVTQCLVIVSAIAAAAFPNLSGLVHSQPAMAEVLFRRWLWRVTALMMVVSVSLAFLLPSILGWWIGPGLPAHSVAIGQILCIGVFANSIGQMYYAKLHAHGRSDVTAKFHIIELPIYLFALYYLIGNMGVIGAAVAWSGRTTLDTIFLWGANHLQMKAFYKDRMTRVVS